MQTLNADAIALANRHGQEQFPVRPIWSCFSCTVQRKIKTNPFGAITLAAQAIEDREAVYHYIDSLPVDPKLRREIKAILMLDYSMTRQ